MDRNDKINVLMQRYVMDIGTLQKMTMNEIDALVNNLKEIDIPILYGGNKEKISFPVYLWVQRPSGECFVINITADRIEELFGGLDYTAENLKQILYDNYGEFEGLEEAKSEIALMQQLGKKHKKNVLLRAELDTIDLLLEDYPEYKI